MMCGACQYQHFETDLPGAEKIGDEKFEYIEYAANVKIGGDIFAGEILNAKVFYNCLFSCPKCHTVRSY